LNVHFRNIPKGGIIFMRLLVILTAVFLLIAGCSGNNQANERETDQPLNVTQVKNSVIEQTDRKTENEIANRLVDLAVQVPHVNDARAVVVGDYAVVGIDIDGDIERSQSGTIKYSVGEILQNDPYGANAVVVADPDLNARLKEVTEDFQNGKPASGIINELSDIAGRVIPEVPGDVLDSTPGKSMEEKNESLENNDEKQLLNKEQENQSKGDN
jgi:YhcN/YlaJ family sporulation lipoprotein